MSRSLSNPIGILTYIAGFAPMPGPQSPWPLLRLGARASFRTCSGPTDPGAPSQEEVIEVTQQDGVITARIRERWPATGVVSHNHRRWSDAGWLPDIGPMESPVGPVLTRASSGLYLPARPREGEGWSWAVDYESPIATMRVSAEMRCLGSLTVETPCGPFVVLRVRQRLRNRLASAGVAPRTHAQEDELFIAPGLGAVLSVGRGWRTMTALDDVALG